MFGMNVMPMFMPPTWIILFFFFSTYHLSLLPTVILGAVAATSGRVVLAILSGHFRPFMSEKMLANMTALGNYFNTHTHISIPLLFVYAFLPIPSNHVYIAAGLAKIKIRLLALTFLFGRLISYTFWLTVTHRIASSLDRIFGQYYNQPKAFLAEIIGFILLYLFTKLNWKKILSKIH